jgi:beta-lactam-binding protein with PASTA domain
MTDFLEFLKNKTVHRHFLLAIGGLIAFIIVIFLALKVYTRHGQTIEVPDFNSLAMEEVTQAADEKRLEVEVIDSLFVQGQKPGTVLSQNPSAGTLVKSGHVIFLTINAFNPEKINMPNLIGVPIRQAEAMLLSKGFRVGFKQYKPDIARDFVLDQLCNGHSVKAGAQIIKGSVIDLVIGLGAGSSSTEVPNIKGLTKSSAQEILSNNYLNFGALIFDNSIQSRQDSLAAVIVKQKPEAGTSIVTGMPVDVWLTNSKNAVASDTLNSEH